MFMFQLCLYCRLFSRARFDPVVAVKRLDHIRIGDGKCLDHFQILRTTSKASAYSTPAVIPLTLPKCFTPSYERG